MTETAHTWIVTIPEELSLEEHIASFRERFSASGNFCRPVLMSEFWERRQRAVEKTADYIEHKARFAQRLRIPDERFIVEVATQGMRADIRCSVLFQNRRHLRSTHRRRLIERKRHAAQFAHDVDTHHVRWHATTEQWTYTASNPQWSTHGGDYNDQRNAKPDRAESEHRTSSERQRTRMQRSSTSTRTWTRWTWRLERPTESTATATGNENHPLMYPTSDVQHCGMHELWLDPPGW